MPKFDREIEIDAPVEKVWEVLTDPQHWPRWFPGFDSVSNVTSVREGGTFKWTDEGRTGQGKIVKMEPLKYLEIETQIGNDKDSHVFKLRSSGGFLGAAEDECKVEYILDTLLGGGVIARFVTGGNPIDGMKVNKTVHRLRKLVESM